MLLQQIKDCTLEEAAKRLAGNWKSWNNFCWFGSDDIPNNEDVCLGYLVCNHEICITDHANSEVVLDAMKPWMGEHCGEALVGPFGSSVSGQKNVVQGIQIRVYENGAITEPFKKLHELSKKLNDSDVLEQSVRDDLNREIFIEFLAGELPQICGEKGVEYTDALPAQIFALLEEYEEADFDDGEYYERVESTVDDWVVIQSADEKHGLYPEVEDIAN